MKNIVAFTIIGASAGFLYYYLIGCNNTCSITSSSYNSILYGAFCGIIIGIPSKKGSDNFAALYFFNLFKCNRG